MTRHQQDRSRDESARRLGSRNALRSMIQRRRSQNTSSTVGHTGAHLENDADDMAEEELSSPATAASRHLDTHDIIITRTSTNDFMSYDAARSILHNFRASTAGFPILQDAVLGFMLVIERKIASDGVEKNMASIVHRIDQMANVFFRFQSGELGDLHILQPWVDSLAQRINDYRLATVKKLRRPLVSRFLSVEEDQHHVKLVQQALSAVVDEFLMTTAGITATQVSRLVRQQSFARLRAVEASVFEAQSISGCAVNTRDKELNELVGWATQKDGPRVILLTGDPLTGKTYTTYDLCQYLARLHLLGGSFFCSRETADRRDFGRVFPTLAYSLAHSAAHLGHQVLKDGELVSTRIGSYEQDVQHALAQARSQYASGLTKVLEENIGTMHSSPQHQFESLILKPFSTAMASLDLPCIFVIDGLDKFDDSENTCYQLLEIITQSIGVPNIKFVVSTRLEQHIHDAFNTFAYTTENTRSLYIKDPQIVLDMVSELSALHQRHRLPANWPPLDQARALTWQAGEVSPFGTVARWYIFQPDGHPDKRLCEICSIIKRPHQLTKLEKLYDLVLEGSDVKLGPHGFTTQAFHYIQSISFLMQSLSAADLGIFTQSSGHMCFLTTFEPFILLQGNDSLDKAGIHGPHWRRYFNDRSSYVYRQWHIAPAEAHLCLLRCCLNIMDEELHFNICNAQSSYFSNEKQDLQSKVPGHIAYACAYWIEHLKLSTPQEETLQLATSIIQQRFLFWLEVMSATGRIGNIVALFGGLQQFALDNSSLYARTTLLSLANFARLASEFIVETRHVVSVSAPHIYLSVLGLAPGSTSLLQALSHENSNFTRKFARIFKEDPPDMRNTGLRSQTSSHFMIRPHIHAVAYSIDGQRLASASSGNDIHLWDVKTGAPVSEPIRGHTQGVNTVAFASDGRRLASASDDQTVRIWDVQGGYQIGNSFEGHSCAVNSVAFSPDGRFLVSGSLGAGILIWDTLLRMKCDKQLSHAQGDVTSLAFSPDGQILACGTDAGNIKLWNFVTGAQQGEMLTGHTQGIRCIAFSPDGRQLASASSDHTVRLWHPNTGKQLGNPLEGHTDWARSVAFSPNGQHLASGSDDKTIRLWNVNDRTQIGRPLEGHSDYVRSVTFSPDGRQLASGSEDGTIRFWDVSEDNTSNNTRATESRTEVQTGPLTSSGHGVMAFSPFPEHHGSHEFLLPSGQPLDHRDLFRLDVDGWIRGPCEELILWIPLKDRRGLWRPRTQGIIGEQHVYLDLSCFVHGKNWTQCYKADAADDDLSELYVS